MPEIWKPIPGFSRYEASDRGRVRSLWTQRGKRKKPCLIGLNPVSHGYHLVGLRKNGRTYNTGVHRLVLLVFKGPCPDGMECSHLDDDRSNNRLKNLKWGTRSENQQMRVARRPETYRNKQNLSNHKVVQLKKKCSAGKFCQNEIAKQFGVSESTVSKIVNGHRRRSSPISAGVPK